MLNILPGTSWLLQAATMSQLRSTKGLSLQGKILQHLTKRQITSLPNKLSCVQRSILVLQWLLQTTKMCLSSSSFIIWMNALLVQYLWSHPFSKDHLSTLRPQYKPTEVSYPVYQQPISYPGATLYLHTSGLTKELSWRISLSDAPNSLLLFGCLDVPLSDGVNQATKFISVSYGNRVGNETMSDIRYKIWTTKSGNTATSTPKMQALPPTTESFIENVKRSNLQTDTIWKAALSLGPSTLDAGEYGYVRHEPSKTLLPTAVPNGVTLAPDEIMMLIKCNCEGASACRNMGCSPSKLECTLFCKCNAGDECFNELTQTVAILREFTDELLNLMRCRRLQEYRQNQGTLLSTDDLL